MSEKTTTTVTGLRMFAFAAPFKDYMGALVDIDGPWTEAMLERHDEEPERAGLWVWEGQCVVTVECAGTEDEDTSFVFDGKSRAPTNEEMQLLADDRTPLRGLPMPYLEDSANLLNVERPLHLFDVYGGEEETVIAYDAADARAVQMELGISAADLEGAVFKQYADDADFAFRERVDEKDGPVVTKTCAEWAKEKGRGFFSTTYA